MNNPYRPGTGLDVVGIGALNCDYILPEGEAGRYVVDGVHWLLAQAGMPVQHGTEGHVPEPVMRQLLAHLAHGGARPTVTLGGSAFNTIRTLAATDSALRTGYVGAAGQDPATRSWPHADELSRLGVDTQCLCVVPGQMPGTCLACTARGERALITTTGANAAMAGHVSAEFSRLAAYLRRAGIVHLTSFLDQHTPHHLLTLLQAVTSTGPRPLICFDPGHHWCRTTGAAVDGLLALSDYVLLNQRELAALGGTGRAREAATRVLRKTSPGTSVIVKHPGGTRTYTVNGARVEEKFHPHQPVSEPELQGDVGAGDAFAAGLLAALARGPRDLTSAIRSGAHLARTHLTGGLASIPALATTTAPRELEN